MANSNGSENNQRKKKVRVEFRRNRARPARDRSWARQYKDHGFEESETTGVERVVAKGDLSRKRTVRSPDRAPNLPEGRVTAMRGLIAQVEIDGHTHACAVRRLLRTRLIKERHLVTVGDRVRVNLSPRQARSESPSDRRTIDIEGMIEWVAARTGCLTRRYANRTQTIAANVDQAVIVSSAAEPYCKPHLIDRYLVSVHAGDITPVICFNKIDLDADRTIPPIRRRYADLGYRTLATSAVTHEGLDELETILKDKTSVIVGQSGVGKSSMLNVIQPGLNLRVGKISRETEKGTHTTTTAELLALEVGGYVVDTPGIKTLEPADVGKQELEMYYVDIARFVAGCKFPDCTHTHETDCAVKRAVQDGTVHPERYESYVRLFQDD